MEVQQLGCCGLDCAVCPAFVATANHDTALRAETAREWSRLYAEYLGGQVLKPEEMDCRGCLSAGDVFAGCLTCPIRKCCRERKLATCAGCTEYETCGMLNGFLSVTSHGPAKDNLERLRTNG